MNAVAAEQHEPEVLLRVEDRVAWLTFNRPQQMNAITLEMAEDLVRTAADLRDAVERDEVRVIVLHGAGERAFCSGADLKQRRTMDEEQLWRHATLIREFVFACHGSPVPVIAAIHGHCLGGGLEIAVACDLRVASEGASMGFTEARIGAFPGAGGAVFAPRLIGVAAAKDLLYTGRRVTGAEAEELGLVQRTMPEAELLTTASELASAIAGNGPLAIRALKTLIDRGADLPLDGAMALSDALRRPLNATEDYAEGLAAFAERRPPMFRGR